MALLGNRVDDPLHTIIPVVGGKNGNISNFRVDIGFLQWVKTFVGEAWQKLLRGCLAKKGAVPLGGPFLL